LDGRSLYVEAGLDRRANEMKKRMADGLRAASDSELAELAGALGLEAKAVRRALG
jgi:hypothetical protein